MVLPAILGAYFVLDLVVMFATGEDIIQHLTGVDIYAPIVDPIVNFLLPDGGGGSSSAQDIIDNQDAWGVALMDGLSMIFTALIIIAILVFLLLISKRKNGGK